MTPASFVVDKEKPSSWILFFTFLRIGAFTFGGGYAMLSLVRRDTVEKHSWLQEKEFWEMMTVVQSLPGVFAVNTALYVGRKIGGPKGAMAACLGAVLPSILIILVIAMFFSSSWHHPVVERIFKGIRPCVVALILAPSVQMARSVGLNWKTAVLPLLALIAIVWVHISPVWVLLCFGFVGAIRLFWKERKRGKKENEQEGKE